MMQLGEKIQTVQNHQCPAPRCLYFVAITDSGCCLQLDAFTVKLDIRQKHKLPSKQADPQKAAI